MKFGSIGTVLWNRRWVVAAVLVIELALSPFLLRLTRPTYEATAELAYVGAGPNSLLGSGDLPNLVYSEAVMERVKSRLHSSASVDDIRLATSAKVTPRSSVLPIGFSSHNPQRALIYANAVADATVAEYQKLGVQQYDVAIGMIQNQLASESARIRDIDARLQHSIQNHSFVGSPQALDTISLRLDDLQSQRATAHAQLVADQGAASSLAGGPAESGLKSVVREQILQTDQVYQAVRKAQSTDVAQYEGEKAGYTDAFPGLAGLKEKVQHESAAVDAAANEAVAKHGGASPTYANVLLSQRTATAQVAGDKARVDAIDAEVADARQRLSDLSKFGVAADQLRLERDSAQAAYTGLRGRLATEFADKAQSGAIGSVVVLDHAQEAFPKLPREVLDIILALLILALAIASAYIAESLNPRIRNRAGVEALYGTQHIGSV